MTTQRAEALALAHLALTGVRLSTPGQNTLARDVLADRPSAPAAPTDEEVERAARAWREAAESVNDDLMGPWESIDDADRDRAMRFMRAALTAARTVVATPQDTTPDTEGDRA